MAVMGVGRKRAVPESQGKLRWGRGGRGRKRKKIQQRRAEPRKATGGKKYPRPGLRDRKRAWAKGGKSRKAVAPTPIMLADRFKARRVRKGVAVQSDAAE